VKPVVTRLVVFGAAVGSLALLAGAVTLVLRLAPPTEYPVDLSIEGWINDLRPSGQIKVADDLYEEKRLARSAKAASTVKPAEMPSPAPVPKPESPVPRQKAEPPRVAQPKVPTPAPAAPPRPRSTGS